MTPIIGELIGTMILIIFGGGVVAGANLKKTFAYNGGWIVITIAWGLAVTMGVFAVGSISGAHLNPAVTFALAINGDFAWGDVPGYFAAQVAGGFLGAVIVYLHYLPHWQATDDEGAKLAVFSTSPAIPHTFANLLSETIGTFVLVLGLLFIGANNFTEGLNPIAVGLLIVVIGMSLGGTTGYAINPARDLGPRIAHALLPIHGKGSSKWGYAWIPVVGPIMGGALGAVFYQMFFEQQMSAIFLGVIALSSIILAAAWNFGKKDHKYMNTANKAV